MLAKSKVQEFLARELDDLTWIKHLSDKDLWGLIQENAPGQRFVVKPYRHQLEMFLIGLYIPNFLYFAEMGLGKTSVILNLLLHYRTNALINSALVCVPNVANIQNWVDEAAYHVPDLPVTPLFGSTEERAATLERVKNTVFVINYQGLVYLCTGKKPPSQVKKKKSTDRARVVDIERVTNIAKGIDALVLDESQEIRSWTSTVYKITRSLSSVTKYRFALTGTPMGRDPHHLWPQFYVIDHGATLGGTLGIFREAYFKRSIGHWGEHKYKLLPGAKKAISRALLNSSIRYKTADCVDLPKQVFSDIKIPMPKASLGYYHTLTKEMKTAGGNYSMVENVFIRMRQISSGFLSLKNDVGKINVTFQENPKLDALLGLIDATPDDCKMVVFHEFIYTGELISKALNKAHVTHATLWGSTKDKPGAVKRFQTSPKVRVLVVNSKSGGTGLNLQIANYVVFFEQPVDPITHSQAVKRCHRIGQTKTVFYYNLLMLSTVDIKISGYLKEGRDLLRAVVDGKETLT